MATRSPPPPLTAPGLAGTGPVASGLAASPASGLAASSGSGLAAYPVDVDAGDLYRHAGPEVAAKWRHMADGLAAHAREAGLPVHELVSRQIQDLGMSFRIAGDVDERAWPLSPMPLIVDAEEWGAVERGLIQRAALLEAISADIYGPQRLVAQGHLPAAVISGSRYFARAMIGHPPPGGHYLHVYAADLARGPRGQWRVLTDRLRLANGIGYALENRLALGRASGGLLTDINARRLAGFFSELAAGIAADCGREAPRIGLLTPGRFNQSYPEQAHLARYLGFPLVEGRDLVVIDDRLYVRTISGPKRIDALWRWLDTNALDPLHFDARSSLGVPGLFDAWANGGLGMANWPGVELLEAPALAAFLPRLARGVLGEEALLPNVATWWCGQPREAAAVAERFDELTIAPAFGHAVEVLGSGGPVAGASLDKAQRAALREAMARRPMDYCGQEIVHLSTTPALTAQGFEPRAFTVRAFVARGADGSWTVMPGGFARLSGSGAMLTTLMGEGDFSADLCIVDRKASPLYERTTLGAVPAVRRQSGILAAQAADNLYWFGRYAERAEMVARLVRALLGGSLAGDTLGANPEVRAMLVALLVEWGALDQRSRALPVLQAAHAVFVDPVGWGALPALDRHLKGAGMALRDRFAPDFWRIAARPLPRVEAPKAAALQRAAGDVIERFCALAGLAGEDMVRGPAWRFLDLGRRLERAISITRMIRHFAFAETPEGAEDPGAGAQQAGLDRTEALSVLLDLADSQITYRARYLAGPAPAPVLDLLLLDDANPRALVFQLRAVAAHLAELPAQADDGLPEAQRLAAEALLAPLRSVPVTGWDQALLQRTEAGLLALSDAIAERYFLQFERSGAVGASLLA